MAEHREIIVLSGPHAGARWAVGGQPGTLGTSSECAIVLADPQLRPVHLLIEAARRGAAVTPFGDVAVEADETSEGDVTHFVPGTPRLLLRDTILTAGETRLLFKLTSPDSDLAAVARSPRSRAGRRVITAALVALSLFGVSAALLYPNGRPASSARASTLVRLAPRPVPSAAAALTFLRAAAAARGLASISFEAGSDGTVVASGDLPSADHAVWESVARAFDARYEGRVVMLDQVGTFDGGPVLTVAAVWLGANPYVVDGGGDWLHEGAALPNGWRLAKIDEGSLLLHRGGRTLRLRY